MNLADLAAGEGYPLVVDPRPWERPDALGRPPDPSTFTAALADHQPDTKETE